MKNMKKPRVLREEYEIRVVQTPPPGPPEYEPVDMWPHPRKPRKQSRESKTPIIISLTALFIAILSIFFTTMLIQNPLLPQTFFNTVAPTTVTTIITQTLQITTVSQTTIESIENLSIYLNSSCLECIDKNTRLMNLEFRNHNTTHILFSLNISIPEGIEIDENNFIVEVDIGRFQRELTKSSEESYARQTYRVVIYFERHVSEVVINFKYTSDQEGKLCQLVRFQKSSE